MSNQPKQPRPQTSRRAWKLPPIGEDPSGSGATTTPGSFANASQVGGPLAFSSPDTPGMPAPSSKTAWDFMPRTELPPVTQL